MTELALEMKDVHKRYPVPRRLRRILLHPFERCFKDAVKGISLAVPSGELITIMGPTGAGKTTLLKMIATLLLPTRGEVKVWGMPIGVKDTQVKERVGFVVSDERSFYWRLTGRENLEFFAALNGYFGARRDKCIDHALETVGLMDVAKERFTGYSSGMRQKMAIARGLLHDPDLLIMDEPTRSLDPADQVRVAKFVVDRLVNDLGRTVILATHDLALVDRLSQRVLMLRDGRIRDVGTKLELAERLGVRPAVKIDLSTSMDRCTKTLGRVPGVSSVEHLPSGSIRLALTPGTSSETLLHALIAADLTPRSFSPEDASWGRIAETVAAKEEEEEEEKEG